MTQKPDADIAALLAAKGFGAVGQDIVIGEPLAPTEPGAGGVKLWVWAQGGPAPEAIMQRDPNDGHLMANFDATVFVRIRDVVGGQWAATRDLAVQVLQALMFPTAAGYWDIWPDTSYPEDLGPLPSGQFEWQVVVSAKFTA